MFLQESSGNLLLEKQTHLKATRRASEFSTPEDWDGKDLSSPTQPFFCGQVEPVPPAGISGALCASPFWWGLWRFGGVPSELGVMGAPRSMGGMKGNPGGAAGRVWAGDNTQGTKDRQDLGKRV